MGTIIGEGITFDDVLLVPAYSGVIRQAETDCAVGLCFIQVSFSDLLRACLSA